MPPEFLFLYARLDYACNIFLKEIAAIQQKKKSANFSAVSRRLAQRQIIKNTFPRKA